MRCTHLDAAGLRSPHSPDPPTLGQVTATATTFSSLDPRTGEVVGTYPVHDAAAVEAAVARAVEVKRRGEIDGVEQLTRYLELMNRDPLLAPVAGVFAAQQIKPQARTLAQDRGIRCVTVNYDALRGMESDDLLLF